MLLTGLNGSGMGNRLGCQGQLLDPSGCSKVEWEMSLSSAAPGRGSIDGNRSVPRVGLKPVLLPLPPAAVWATGLIPMWYPSQCYCPPPRCNRTRQRPGPDNDHTIWSFSGPEISGPDNDHQGLDNNQSLCGPKILGLHNDVRKIVRSLSGPETPGVTCATGQAPPTVCSTRSTRMPKAWHLALSWRSLLVFGFLRQQQVSGRTAQKRKLSIFEPLTPT